MPTLNTKNKALWDALNVPAYWEVVQKHDFIVSDIQKDTKLTFLSDIQSDFIITFSFILLPLAEHTKYKHGDLTRALEKHLLNKEYGRLAFYSQLMMLNELLALKKLPLPHKKDLATQITQCLMTEKTKNVVINLASLAIPFNQVRSIEDILFLEYQQWKEKKTPQASTFYGLLETILSTLYLTLTRLGYKGKQRLPYERDALVLFTRFLKGFVRYTNDEALVLSATDINWPAIKIDILKQLKPYLVYAKDEENFYINVSNNKTYRSAFLAYCNEDFLPKKDEFFSFLQWFDDIPPPSPNADLAIPYNLNFFEGTKCACYAVKLWTQIDDVDLLSRLPFCYDKNFFLVTHPDGATLLQLAISRQRIDHVLFLLNKLYAHNLRDDPGLFLEQLPVSSNDTTYFPFASKPHPAITHILLYFVQYASLDVEIKRDFFWDILSNSNLEKVFQEPQYQKRSQVLNDTRYPLLTDLPPTALEMTAFANLDLVFQENQNQGFGVAPLLANIRSALVAVTPSEAIVSKDSSHRIVGEKARSLKRDELYSAIRQTSLFVEIANQLTDEDFIKVLTPQQFTQYTEDCFLSFALQTKSIETAQFIVEKVIYYAKNVAITSPSDILFNLLWGKRKTVWDRRQSTQGYGRIKRLFAHEVIPTVIDRDTLMVQFSPPKQGIACWCHTVHQKSINSTEVPTKLGVIYISESTHSPDHLVCRYLRHADRPHTQMIPLVKLSAYFKAQLPKPGNSSNESRLMEEINTKCILGDLTVYWLSRSIVTSSFNYEYNFAQQKMPDDLLSDIAEGEESSRVDLIQKTLSAICRSSQCDPLADWILNYLIDCCQQQKLQLTEAEVLAFMRLYSEHPEYLITLLQVRQDLQAPFIEAFFERLFHVVLLGDSNNAYIDIADLLLFWQSQPRMMQCKLFTTAKNVPQTHRSWIDYSRQNVTVTYLELAILTNNVSVFSLMLDFISRSTTLTRHDKYTIYSHTNSIGSTLLMLIAQSKRMEDLLPLFVARLDDIMRPQQVTLFFEQKNQSGHHFFNYVPANKENAPIITGIKNRLTNTSSLRFYTLPENNNSDFTNGSNKSTGYEKSFSA